MSCHIEIPCKENEVNGYQISKIKFTNFALSPNNMLFFSFFGLIPPAPPPTLSGTSRLASHLPLKDPIPLELPRTLLGCVCDLRTRTFYRACSFWLEVY